ncbi:MAG: ABC transporter ATP-binding protein [Spirochaetaceae bacterium]|jgi:ABC-type multidrug transport system ATPase subunit|nr:ABC transporter ATP-binding protein [Spirochaetaceae bacterium]
MEILSLQDVSFSSQNTQIVREVNLSIEEGKTTALVGPSGCGKSTLLKLSAGLIIPTGGTVCYRGRDIAGMTRAQNMEFRRESAFVFQDSALWANQSLQQCMELPLRIHFPEMTKEARQRRIDEVVKTVGYKRNLAIRPAVLSMGEQKLIAFGRAMLCKPKLLFLDEWTESLDENAARRLISLVKQLKLENNTIVFVSHNMGIIRDLADNVIVVVEGHVHNKMTHDQIDNDHDELSELLGEGITQDKV